MILHTDDRELQIAAVIIPVAVGIIPVRHCRWSDNASVTVEFDLPICPYPYVVSYYLSQSLHKFREETCREFHDGSDHQWKRHFPIAELHQYDTNWFQWSSSGTIGATNKLIVVSSWRDPHHPLTDDTEICDDIAAYMVNEFKCFEER